MVKLSCMYSPRVARGGLAACIAGAILLLCSVVAFAQTEAKLYERVEETMTNSTSFDNPFTDTELRLDVTAPSGRSLGSEFTWYGFHDGNGNGGQDGDVWKFRMIFDEPGDWTVEAGFYEPGTSTSNGPSETFTYSVSSTPIEGGHGHIRHDARNPMRFAFDDGTPWVPFSTHSSMLLDRENPQTAYTWIDEHRALGVNAMGIRFHTEAGAVDEQKQFHWLAGNGSRASSRDGLDYSRFDVATWHHNEQALTYAQDKGAKLFIWFGMSALNGQYGTYGPLDHNGSTLGPLQELYIRYFLARWAAFSCWWHWTVSSEWEEAGQRDLQINHAKALQSQNPWKTLVSNHSLGDWSLGGTDEGWGLATLQKRVGDSDDDVFSGPKAFIEDNDHHGIPVFNCEGVWELDATRARIATMTHLMAGGYSNIANWDQGHKDGSWGSSWPDYCEECKNDAAAIGMLAKFFNRADIDINPCTPAHDLVSVSGGHTAMCLAQEGTQYYVWADEGGTPSLDLGGQNGIFHVVRYDGSDLPADGGGTELDDITGGEEHALGSCPESGFGNDYLFAVTKEGAVRTNENIKQHLVPTSKQQLLTPIAEQEVRVSVSGAYVLDVYTVTGDLVARHGGSGSTTYSLPQSLGKGMYLLRVRAGNRGTVGDRLRIMKR